MKCDDHRRCNGRHHCHHRLQLYRRAHEHVENVETSFLRLAEGSKIEAMEVSTHCGGGAINAAVAMARLGADVGVVVKLGNDRRAEEILQRLNMEGASTQRVLRDESAITGASVIIASHDRNATIFTYRGANTHLAGRISSAKCSRSISSTSPGYRMRRRNASPTSSNARAHTRHSSPQIPEFAELSSRGSVFLDHLGRVDLLVVNRSEAEALVPELVSRFGESGPPLGPEPSKSAPRWRTADWPAVDMSSACARLQPP